MNANELMIGNYVFVSKYDIARPIKVRDLRRLLCKDKTLNIRPIPITAEWLLKFGFKDDSPEYCKDGSNGYWLGRYNYVYHGLSKEAKYFRVYRNPETDWNKKDIRGHRLGEWMFYNSQSWVRSVEYVHQLQNIYFAMTGEHLTLSNE
jgi:hypothetical protein